MSATAKYFFAKELQNSVRNIQKSMFEIIDDIRCDDLDNSEALKDLLQDEDLANKFLIFQEHRSKLIRKKILDNTNDLNRKVDSLLKEYAVDFEQETEIQGIMVNENNKKDKEI